MSVIVQAPETEHKSTVDTIRYTIYTIVTSIYTYVLNTFEPLGNTIVSLVESLLYYIDVVLDFFLKVGYYCKLTRAFFRYGMYNKIN